mmetsp:Transcript_24260/g.79117  ORF Transcript_24260/g.79117 Transcript_24260/m.79117 type:complete len:216 (-) Transcript_24260:969-1616(-)
MPSHSRGSHAAGDQRRSHGRGAPCYPWRRRRARLRGSAVNFGYGATGCGGCWVGVGSGGRRGFTAGVGSARHESARGGTQLRLATARAHPLRALARRALRHRRCSSWRAPPVRARHQRRFRRRARPRRHRRLSPSAKAARCGCAPAAQGPRARQPRSPAPRESVPGVPARRAATETARAGGGGGGGRARTRATTIPRSSLAPICHGISGRIGVGS